MTILPFVISKVLFNFFLLFPLLTVTVVYILTL